MTQICVTVIFRYTDAHRNVCDINSRKSIYQALFWHDSSYELFYCDNQQYIINITQRIRKSIEIYCTKLPSAYSRWFSWKFIRKKQRDEGFISAVIQQLVQKEELIQDMNVFIIMLVCVLYRVLNCTILWKTSKHTYL